MQNFSDDKSSEEVSLLPLLDETGTTYSSELTVSARVPSLDSQTNMLEEKTIQERLVELYGLTRSESSKTVSENEEQHESADSLATALSQALQSNDNTMLETCLSVSDTAIIHGTVFRLTPNRIVPLLNRFAI